MKYLRIALFFILSLASSAQAATVLSNAAGALSAGSWSGQIATSNFNAGNILRPHNQGGLGSSLEYMDKGVWNPVANSVMIFGGAHGSPPVGGTDSTVFAIYGDAAGLWRSSCDNVGGVACTSSTGLPSPFPSLINAFSCPGKPAGTGCGIGHGYHETTIDPNTGDLYHRGSGEGKVIKFSQSTQTWSACSTWSSSQQVANALEYFPDRNSLVYTDGDWGVWELSLASGNCTSASWIQRASTIGGGFTPQLLGLSSYHNQSMYSPRCSCILMVGQDTTTVWRMNSDATFTQVSNAPQVPGVPQEGSGAIFTRDPVSGNILMWHNSNAATTMYQYDPAANSWSTISRASPMFPGPEGGVTETIAVPISTYGVIMFVQVGSSSGGKVHLYKHAVGTGTPPPPTAPTVNISANPASVLSGLVSTLSWSSTNATSCNASGGWSGAKAVSGSQITVNLLAATTFTLTCTGSGGSASQSTTVAITGSTPPPAPPPSGTPTLLVKFGKTSALNSFGLSGWSTVIKDVYTDYQDIGPGGTTIVVGDNYTYNYQGVTGTPKTLSSGDKIRVTWYNNSSAAVGFIPNISFTSADRIIAGTGTWYPMTSVTVPPFGSATSEYAFTSASAGSYSLVNVNVNYTNSQVIVADKIELFPVGSSTSPSFDFALSNGGSKSVAQGQSVSNSIGASVISGTAQAVTFSASGLPAGATASFSPTSCSPSCSPTLSINTTGSTPGGSSTVTVTGVGGGVTRTTAFTLTVSAPTTPPPTGGSADFQTRCTASGVVRCFGFDTVADLGGTYGNNFGNFNNAGACNTTTIRCPVIDTTLTASGAGSLKFTQPSQSGAGAAGQWFTNFSPDLVTQFGAGGEFWIQWRQRFDTAFTTNVYTGGDGEGPKQVNISGADSPGCTVANNTNCRSSNVDIELVMQNLSQRKYAQMYGYLERSGEPQQFTQLADGFGGSDFRFQNARPTPPGCLYSMGSNWQALGGNCIGYFPNEWMTFKVHVKLGSLSGPYWTNTQIDMWIGREGQALQPAISWTGNYGASSNKFGKIWLVPYITNKDASQAHPQANTWYDELIISTQNIADPGTGTGGGSQPPAAPAAPSGLVLK